MKKDSPKPLEQALEKIGQMTRVQRILVAVVLCVAVVGLAVWLFYLPKLESLSTLTEDIADLEKKLADATEVAQKYDEFKARKERMEVQYREGLLLLPDTKEIPSLLDAIARNGRESGLDFVLFRPNPEVAGKTFAEMPVSIEVVGDYHHIAGFFGKLADMSRLVNIKDMKIKPQKSRSGESAGLLLASMNAVTYRFLEKSDKKSDGSQSADKAKDASKKG